MTRLDIAYEEVEEILSNQDLHHEVKRKDGIIIHQIEIYRHNQIIQNDPGRYATIEFESLNDAQIREDVSDAVAECIRTFLETECDKILIVGLGNQNVTADSLGPDTAEKILVTSHLNDEIRGNCPKISVLAPGVMGQTGIETAKIVQAVVKHEHPDAVIAVDALATKSLRRINHVIQITDTGIHPGSGVKNKRMGLNQKTLDVPVISVGVATVMSVEHLIAEKLKEANAVSLMNHLNCTEMDMVVTPKEIDEIKLHLADVLSQGINKALIPDFTKR